MPWLPLFGENRTFDDSSRYWLDSFGLAGYCARSKILWGHGVPPNAQSGAHAERQVHQRDSTLSKVLTPSTSLRKGVPSSFTKSGAVKFRGPGRAHISPR
jgi:hypothetical protein